MYTVGPIYQPSLEENGQYPEQQTALRHEIRGRLTVSKTPSCSEPRTSFLRNSNWWR